MRYFILTTIFLFLLSVPAFSAVIILEWDASPSQDVVGYNIYMGNVSGGPYNFDGYVSALTYTFQVPDSVEENYCFVATALDDVGNESVYSNEACGYVDTVKPGAPVLHKLRLER
jgi:hypothetical protein